MATSPDEKLVPKVLEESARDACTPTRAEVMTAKSLDGLNKGYIGGLVGGLVVGGETGPGALLTSGVGAVVGGISGAIVGAVEGAFIPIEPNGACMVKKLLGENVTPLDTPGNGKKSDTPKRTV